MKFARYVYYNNRLKVFESRMLSKIFGSKTESCETGENGMTKFHDLYSENKYYLRDQIKENEKGGACSTFGGEEKWVQGLDGENRKRLKCMSFPSL